MLRPLPLHLITDFTITGCDFVDYSGSFHERFKGLVSDILVTVSAFTYKSDSFCTMNGQSLDNFYHNFLASYSCETI